MKADEKKESMMILSFLTAFGGWDLKAIPWAGELKMRNRFEGENDELDFEQLKSEAPLECPREIIR